MIKKFVGLLLILLMSGTCFGANIFVDDSLHSQIAEKYDLQDLPNLPNNLESSENIFTPNEFDTAPDSKYTPNQPTQTTQTKQTTTNSQPTQQAKSESQPTQQTNTPQKYPNEIHFNSDFEAVKIKKGTKFKVVNSKELSDSMPRGTKITFTSTIAETNRYVTVPRYTIFKGVVEDSHKPNLTGNGGLLVIKVTKMHYKNADYPINAYVTFANKKVFFNNIKGQRRYWKNVGKSTAWGKKVYDRMWGKTKKYFKPGIEIILTPITFITGTVSYGANIVASPVLAIFSKGGRLVIPVNSKFEIKLLEDTIIYK